MWSHWAQEARRFFTTSRLISPRTYTAAFSLKKNADENSHSNCLPPRGRSHSPMCPDQYEAWFFNLRPWAGPYSAWVARHWARGTWRRTVNVGLWKWQKVSWSMWIDATYVKVINAIEKKNCRAGESSLIGKGHGEGQNPYRKSQLARPFFVFKHLSHMSCVPVCRVFLVLKGRNENMHIRSLKNIPSSHYLLQEFVPFWLITVLKATVIVNITKGGISLFVNQVLP